MARRAKQHHKPSARDMAEVASGKASAADRAEVGAPPASKGKRRRKR